MAVVVIILAHQVSIILSFPSRGACTCVLSRNYVDCSTITGIYDKLHMVHHDYDVYDYDVLLLSVDVRYLAP